MTKKVLQGLQPIDKCPNLGLVEEALQEFDDVPERLQRNPQPVSLCRGFLCKALAALSSPTIASFDQLRRNIGDRRKQESGALRYRLLSPLARFKPSQQAQHRFGESFREDRLFRIVEGCLATLLHGPDQVLQLRAG
jgi:hypothetical protein